MSDWSVGDLAVCVDDGPCRRTGAPNPCKKGQVYRVTSVELSSLGSIGLCLDGVDFPTALKNACWHGNFRKIAPDAHEACEQEFVTLLKRSKRSVSV